MISHLISLILGHTTELNALSVIASLINAVATFFMLIANICLAVFTFQYVRLTGQLVRTTVGQNRLASAMQAEVKVARANFLLSISSRIRIPLAEWLDAHGQLYLDLKDSDIAALETGSVEVGSEAISHAVLAAYLLRLIRSTLERDTVNPGGYAVRAALDTEELKNAISRALDELQALEQECQTVIGGEKLLPQDMG
jgi:K+-sensing histidine kinase KdpD